MTSFFYEEPNLKIQLIKDPETEEYIQFQWKSVVGYEDKYRVSNYGNVKSVDREVPRVSVHGVSYVSKIKGKILQSRKSNTGYLRVTLSNRCKSKSYSIHRLVAQAFVPNPKNKPIVHHINNDKTDNLYINLTWCSISENTKWHHKLDISLKGEKHHQTTLSNEQVMEICELLDSKKLTIKEIAEKYKVGSYTISKINRGTSWEWLTGRSDVKNGAIYTSKAVINCRGEVFTSMAEAARYYSTTSSGISKVCRGLWEYSGKYSDGVHIQWEYLREKK